MPAKKITKATQARVDAVLKNVADAKAEEKIRAMTAEDKDHKAIGKALHIPALAVAKVQHLLGLVDWSGNAYIATWAKSEKVIAVAQHAAKAAAKTPARKRATANK